MDTSYYKSGEPFFGSWYIKEFLGKGSYGQVFAIEKEDISGTYRAAMKVISIGKENTASDGFSAGMTEENLAEYYSELVAGIVAEFRVMEMLKGNSNIVCYEDHEIRRGDGGGYDIFIRMELLTPIGEHFANEPPDEKETLKLGIDICRALELCHKNNIIHRDVKPGNIFLSKDGNYKLGDFGVAKTMENTVGAFSAKGTFDYMAPEVQLRKPYGAGVDIFSLGIVLYKLANRGRIPHLPAYPEKLRPEDNEIALEKRIRGDAVPLPECGSRMLADVIVKACDSNPENRFSSATEMREALEEVSKKLDAETSFIASDAKIDEKNDETDIFSLFEAAVSSIHENGSASDDKKAEIESGGTEYKDYMLEDGNGIAVRVDKQISHPNKPFAAEAPTVAVPPRTDIASQSIFSVTEEDAPPETRVKKEKVKKPTKEKKSAKPKILRRKKGLRGWQKFIIFLAVLAVIGTAGFFAVTKIPAVGKWLDNVEKTVDGIVELAQIFEKDGDTVDITPDMPGEKPDADVIEWVIDGYEDIYPFRAIERKNINGVPTTETRINDAMTEYSEDSMEFFYSIDYTGGQNVRVLYIDGAPTEHREAVDTMSESEWVLEGYEADTFREYARLYENGIATDYTKYTGKIYRHEYYVKNSDGVMLRFLYVEGAPVSYEEIAELSPAEWVIEDYDKTNFHEIARKYVGGVATDETEYTGAVYDHAEYYIYDTDSYYCVTYVNGSPAEDIERRRVDSLAAVPEAWVIANDYEAGTYKEYTVLYRNGSATGETGYTGVTKQITEWRTEGYASFSPYYQYERMYINGVRTEETRYTQPYKVDPAKVKKPTPTPEKTEEPASSSPQQTAPTPAEPSGSETQEPPSHTETTTLPDYLNSDGTYNYSKLTLEYWYDENDKEYKVYYDKDGNEVIRFETGGYKVHRS